MHTDGERLALVSAIRGAAKPLRTPADLDPLLDHIGDARFVLLGEASHGTSEFYRWRTAITRRLVEEHGFSFVAVEGDWPDCYRVNRFVKHLRESAESAEQVLHAFARWPTWMWANREVIELVEFLRGHNSRHSWDRQVGFYGLDVYSLWESMAAVVEYLDRVDPDAAQLARRAYGCFDRFHGDAQEYARSTALAPTTCEHGCRANARDASRQCPGVSRRRARVVLRGRAECARRDRRGAILPRDDPRRTAVVESARSSHDGHARPADGAPRPDGEGDRVGAQHARGRRALHRHGARRDGERGRARAPVRTATRAWCSSASRRTAAR